MLGGLDDVKRLLDAVVEHSHMRDDLYERVGLAPPRGILFVGPSGTGKTAMARALSGQKQIPLIAIDGPQLYSKWLGESEKALREVFKKARRAAPCILFFDTIDAVAPKFGGDQFGSDVYHRILSQLLRETIICATSRGSSSWERRTGPNASNRRYCVAAVRLLSFRLQTDAATGPDLRLCCRRPMAPTWTSPSAARMDGLR